MSALDLDNVYVQLSLAPESMYAVSVAFSVYSKEFESQFTRHYLWSA
jgi:hypothetical protein